ncbi:MAG: SAM-dependent methyltransferase [Burkholderiales bacterium]|nr:SAM-dependent methyltransferase [Burkholderiales bacterium]
MRSPLPRDQSNQLPEPTGEALSHTQTCAAMLRDKIAKANGWLSFARFMELALYAPGLGYYTAGARKFGADGDFVTAPEISSLFGQCLAQSISEVLQETGGDVLELGPGSGKLAIDVLLALEQLGTLPEKYYLLEVSADLRERQQQAIAGLPAHLAERAVWLTQLPQDFVGVVIANEVLDVIPVHLVTFSSGWIFERGVAVKDGAFVWQDVPAIPAELTAPVAHIQREYLHHAPPDGYLTEVAPSVSGLINSLAHAMKRGALMFIDYGFRGAEFYHPSRITGTLMCHYRHFAHTDPFRFPGLQDITAHVDFSAVADAGIAAELELLGYTTQANFLLASGLTERLARVDPSAAADYLKLTNQVQRLVSPAEMGEFFKVIGFAKDLASPIAAFQTARQLPL